MPVKRRVAKLRDHPVTPDAVRAYAAGDGTALHRALGQNPWQESPLHAGGPRPAWLHSNSVADWDLACALRAELETAMGGENAD